MILFFFGFIHGIEINMTQNNAGTVFSLGYTIFARFYSPKCKISRISAPEFSKAAQHFKKIIFLNIDCTEFSSVCKKHLIISFPSFYLFKDGKLPFIVFTKERTAESMINFIEEKTNLYNTSYSLKPLHKVDFLSYSRVINSDGCIVFNFHLPFYRPSVIYEKIIKENIHIFNGDDKIKFAEMDCKNFNQFCDTASNFPSTRIYVNKEIKFDGIFKSPQEFVSTINSVCHTNRMMNGHLMSHIGIDKMTEIAISKFKKIYNENSTAASEWINRDFTKYLEKSSDIHFSNYTSIKQIKSFIIDIMKKVIKDGPQFLIFYLNSIQKVAFDSKTSMKKRDNLDIRSNIINVFIKYFYH